MEKERTTVLLVEDPPAETGALCTTLEAAGYAVARLAGVEPGLVQARQTQPRVVVLLVQGGAPSGWEAARRLKADPLTARIPVIVLAAERPDRRRVLRSQCDAWHAWPAAPEQVLDVVQKTATERTES